MAKLNRYWAFIPVEHADSPDEHPYTVRDASDGTIVQTYRRIALLDSGWGGRPEFFIEFDAVDEDEFRTIVASIREELQVLARTAYLLKRQAVWTVYFHNGLYSHHEQSIVHDPLDLEAVISPMGIPGDVACIHINSSVYTESEARNRAELIMAQHMEEKEL